MLISLMYSAHSSSKLCEERKEKMGEKRDLQEVEHAVITVMKITSCRDFYTMTYIVQSMQKRV